MKLITTLGRVCVVYLLIHLNVGHFVVTSVGNLGFFLCSVSEGCTVQPEVADVKWRGVIIFPLRLFRYGNSEGHAVCTLMFYQ